MNKRSGFVIGAIILVILCAAFIAGTKQPNTIDIGVISILSGEYASAGENFNKGLQLAAAQYKKNKEKNSELVINLHVEDDGFDAKKGLSAYQKLVSVNKVDALINVSTPTIGAIYDLAVKDGLPVIQFGVPVKAPQADNIFQITPSGEAAMTDFAKHLSASQKYQNAAIVYENTDIQNNFFKAFTKGYSGKYTSYTVDKKNVRSIATNINAQKPDAVIFITNPETGALLVKDIRLLSKNMPKLAFDAQLQTGWNDYKRVLGNVSVLEGALALYTQENKNQTFIESYKAMYNEEPGFLADYGYDSFNALVMGYNTSKNVWVSNIAKEKFSGATGAVSFDDVGVRVQPIQVNVVKNGEIIKLTDSVN